MSETKMPELGQHVIFTDRTGVDCDALVSAVWGEQCINVVIVSSDETRKDQYGRQIVHETSVPKASATSAHGYYFRFVGEDKIPYKDPVAV